MSKKKKAIKVSKHDIGKFCRVLWDDIGATDGIIVEYQKDFQYNPIRVYIPSLGLVKSMCKEQIIKIGKSIPFTDTGLNN